MKKDKKVNSKLQKVKEVYLKIKELWKHPKYHALIVLGFYFIFFAIISIMIRTSNGKQSDYDVEPINTLTNYYEMSNYEYEVEILLSGNINDNNKIKGIKYNDINEFEDEKTKEKYFFKDNDLYSKVTNELVNDTFYIQMASLKNNNLYTLLENQVETNKIEYNDQSIKKEYVMDNILFSGVELNSLSVTTYEKDNYINKIELYFVYNETIYNIEIDYTNINNINSYNSN